MQFAQSEQLLTRAMAVDCQRLSLPRCEKVGIEVWLRRDDMVDPHASGNKFYKMFFNIHRARELGRQTIVSMGGSWSNHLYALAHLAQQFGMKSRAIVRGDRPAKLNAMLSDCQSMGMELNFVGRAHYRLLGNGQMPQLADDEFFIPEGGANALGVLGCEYLGKAVAARQGFADVVCMAVGTGSTLQGVAQGVADHQTAIGFSVLKASQGRTKLAGLTHLPERARLVWGYHLGGYARSLPANALAFWRYLEQSHRVRFDPVYTLKMLWGIEQLAHQGYWSRGTRVLAIHSGGLQGCRGFSQNIDWLRPTHDVHSSG